MGELAFEMHPKIEVCGQRAVAIAHDHLLQASRTRTIPNPQNRYFHSILEHCCIISFSIL